MNKMVEAYNATMKQLKTTGGIMNEFYQQQLKNIPAGSKESLESIGISQAKDGSLIVDEKYSGMRMRIPYRRYWEERRASPPK